MASIQLVEVDGTEEVTSAHIVPVLERPRHKISISTGLGWISGRSSIALLTKSVIMMQSIWKRSYRLIDSVQYKGTRIGTAHTILSKEVIERRYSATDTQRTSLPHACFHPK